jgi:hypothetical protein
MATAKTEKLVLKPKNYTRKHIDDGAPLSAEELKPLTAFFSLLSQIDRRVKKRKEKV